MEQQWKRVTSSGRIRSKAYNTQLLIYSEPIKFAGLSN